MTIRDVILAELKQRFPDVAVSEFRGQVRIQVARSNLYDALQLLKQAHGFDMLVDVTCVDYLRYRGAADRFGLVYLLANTETSERLTLRCMLNEPDLEVPSVRSLWEGANWLEREVWDMYGIRFQAHGDLRRILLPDEFTAHPLRKDYPLQGFGERHHFPVLQRSKA
jgi:NADH-quinone oxidoreductase subunit C